MKEKLVFGVDKVKTVPNWIPNDEQALFLHNKKKKYITVTAYIRHLINREMEKEGNHE